MIAALFLFVGCRFCAAQAAASKPESTSGASAVAMAKWDSDTGRYFGATEQQFDEMGLSKLTADQFEKLCFHLLWREMNAKIDAQEKVLKSEPIADCSPRRTSDKIPVFVNEPDRSEVEFSSALRRSLRAIPDVELTYEEESADVGVVTLLSKNELTNGRIVGYTVALTTYNVCRIGQGPDGYIGRLVANTLLYTSDTLGDLVGKVVGAIDSKDLEKKRRLRSQITDRKR